MRRVRLLGTMAPRNAPAERARLVAAWEAGREERPRWSYVRADHSDLARALEKEAEALEKEEGTPLALAYAARARELALEAELSSAVGTPQLATLAVKRFGPVDPEIAREASELARAWVSAEPPAQTDLVSSDGPEPGSLFSLMREAVGRLKLPFTVIVQPALASLAATGERTIVVTSGRMLAADEARRIVMHEVEAHAVPRARAATLDLLLFTVGSARGTDDQEGFALSLEERHGFLRARRKRELGARHLVVEAMREGATFVDAMRKLVDDWRVPPAEAVAIAERAFRGGDGERAGLGRERVYLESMLRVRKHLAARPTDEAVLASGQVSLEAIPALAPFATWERD